MQTMDITTYIEQHGVDLTRQERQEAIYYVNNAVNNLAAAENKVPESNNVLGRFGSTNSNDVDLFFHLKDEQSNKFTKIIQNYMQEVVNSLAGDSHEARKMDIIFITTKRGQVNWISDGGNIAEINNAIFHTYKNHIVNYDIASDDYRDCPVTSEANVDLGIKTLTSVRALLSIISRTTHGPRVKRLLLSNSLEQRIDTLIEMYEDGGILSAVEETLEKNLRDEALLKDITFSFIQLNALLNGDLVPYTKNAVFNTPHTELLPFVFEMANFTNVYSPQIIKLDKFIVDTLTQAKAIIVEDGEGVLKMKDDLNRYSIRKEIAVDV